MHAVVQPRIRVVSSFPRGVRILDGLRIGVGGAALARRLGQDAARTRDVVDYD